MNSTDNTGLYNRIYNDISHILSPARFRHSLETAHLAWRLCVQYDVDPEKGRIAGLGHDIAREYSVERLLEIIRMHNLQISKWELAHPQVLHGHVGASLFRTDYGVDDEEILEAVRAHVIGTGMTGKLSKVIFAADFCEPTRQFLSERERCRMLTMSLDTLVTTVFEKIFYFLRQERKPVAPLSLTVYDTLVKKRNSG